MKVAVISYHTCPYEPFGRGFSGGMNIYLREVLERISFMDVSIDVFTRSEDDDFISVRNENLKVHHIGCGLCEVPSLENFLEKKDRFAKKALGRLNGRTDLIFSNYWLSAPASLEIKRRRGVKVVHMNHTLEKVKEKYSGSRYGSGPLRQSRLFWEFSVQKYADLLIYPSERDLEVSASYYPWVVKKGEIIHPGISEEFLDLPSRREEGRGLLGLDEDSFVFLYSGRDERTKNLQGLISAFEKLEGKESWLIVVGTDGNGQHGRVRFLPPQKREALITLIDASDCIVVPSYYESFGIFGVEALARGKPIIVSEETCLGKMTSTFGLGEVFHPKKNNALLHALGKCIKGRNSFRVRAGEIANKARQFTWERASSRFLQVLDRLSRA